MDLYCNIFIRSVLILVSTMQCTFDRGCSNLNTAIHLAGVLTVEVDDEKAFPSESDISM